MYHIAVLTKSETQETFYREQLSRFCAEHGLFPRVDCYRGRRYSLRSRAKMRRPTL